MQIIINNKKYILFCIKDKDTNLTTIKGIVKDKTLSPLEVLRHGKSKI